MPSPAPVIYFILGAAGSGRRDILADLIADGFGEGDKAAVLLPESEPPCASDGKFPGAGRWRLVGGDGGMSEASLEAEIPPGTTHLFLLGDGRGNPVDQIEAFAAWLRETNLVLGRILCVVHCRLLEQHPGLVAWYEACLHFSDVALLAAREGVANKWLSEFREREEKEFRPCLFELVRKGRVSNPALVLEPEARRVSHLFDEPWATLPDGEDDDGDEEEGDEVEMTPEEDPYLARYPGGHRVKRIPDIAKFLD